MFSIVKVFPFFIELFAKPDGKAILLAQVELCVFFFTLCLSIQSSVLKLSKAKVFAQVD